MRLASVGPRPDPLCQNPHPRGKHIGQLACGKAVKQLKKERELVQHQLFGLNAAPEAFERLSRKDAQEAPRPSQQFALKVQDSAPTTAGDGRPTALD